MFALEVFEQPVEGQFVGVVVLPVAEIGNEILANLAGWVLSSVILTGLEQAIL